jgi:hypothetical protein
MTLIAISVGIMVSTRRMEYWNMVVALVLRN